MDCNTLSKKRKIISFFKHDYNVRKIFYHTGLHVQWCV